jgi:hypothetical protein
MILGFKQSFPWNEPTYFKEKILMCDATPVVSRLVGPDGQLQTIFKKRHSIREGHRWKVGDTIHMAYGVRTKNYDQFNRGIPSLQKVRAIQNVSIDPREKQVWVYIAADDTWKMYPLNSPAQNQFVINDGFKDADQFWRWFVVPVKGQIIHWTEFEY